MKVKDVMSGSAQSCAPDSNLVAAARLMWDLDCGVLPVEADGKVLGMITDRDICMAAATQSRPLADVNVQEIMSRNVFACRPEDDIRFALETMRRERVRRLPVVDSAGKLQGILSLNDLVLKAQRGKKKTGLSFSDVITTCKAIFEHRDATPPDHEFKRPEGAGEDDDNEAKWA